MNSSSKLREFLTLFLPLYLPAFLFAFSYSLLVPILPKYAEGFQVSYTLIGVLLAGDSIGMLLSDLPSGVVMRRLGQKRSMIIGLILAGASTSMLFWAPTIAWAIAFRMVAGMGNSLYTVSRHFYLTEMTPVRSRGRVISTFGGVFRFGRFLGPLAGGAVALLLGLRASFLSFGAICIVALLIVIFFLPHVEALRVHAPTARPQGGLFWHVLRTHYRSLATAGMGYLFFQIIRSGPVTLIPLYGTFFLHLDVQTIGMIIGFSSGLDMLLFYPAGLLMDRWSRRYTIITSCLCITAGVALVPLAQTAVILLLSGMVAGFGNGLGSGTMMTMGADLSPETGRSDFLGAWSMVGDVGSASGPLLTGKLADLMPLPLTALVIASGGITAAMIFWRLVPETLQKKSPVPVRSQA
jgi:MFS family permease